MFDGKRWVSLNNNSYSFPTHGYTLKPGESMTFSIKLTDKNACFNGKELASGYYRIAKAVRDDRYNAADTLYADFNLTDYDYGYNYGNNYGYNSNYSSYSTSYRYATERVNVRTGPSTKYSGGEQNLGQVMQQNQDAVYIRKDSTRLKIA